MSTELSPDVARTDDADAFLTLVRKFPLRPIDSDEQLNRAVDLLRAIGKQPELSPAEADYMEVLGTLVEQYEDRHVPEPVVPAGEMLRYLIESRGLSAAAVADGAGISESTLLEILSGERPIEEPWLDRLGEYFRIDPAELL